jgi:hypothetical protein
MEESDTTEGPFHVAVRGFTSRMLSFRPAPLVRLPETLCDSDRDFTCRDGFVERLESRIRSQATTYSLRQANDDLMAPRDRVSTT